jgi:hypothetical protein
MDSYNHCVRCGKSRIITKEWTVEEPNGSTTKKSMTVCPDEACQREVDNMLEEKSKERAKKEAARQARLARIHQKSSDVVASI